MASIRNRSPWRVSVAGHPELELRFASKSKALKHAQGLSTQGYGQVRTSQDRDGAWEARVRRRGYPELVETFGSKRAAQEWAAAREGEIVKREFVDYSEADRHTLGDVLKLYEAECAKGSPAYYRVRKLQNESIAQIRLSKLQPSDVEDYRDRLQKLGKRNATIVKELDLLRLVIETARTTYKMPLPSNPASAEAVKRPKLGKDAERDRTLQEEHSQPDAASVARRLARIAGKKRLRRFEQRLEEIRARGGDLAFHPEVAWLLQQPTSEESAVLRAARYPHWFRPVVSQQGVALQPLIKPGLTARDRGPASRIWAVMSFAIHTAMRRGEIAKLRWEYVHLEKGYMDLPGSITKSGYPRVVPLSLRAKRILMTQPRTSELVFDATVGSLEAAYLQVFARCGVTDLRFHDLRHEAATRLVNDFTMPALMVGQITGHRDMRMLQRYYNPKPSDIVSLFHAARK